MSKELEKNLYRKISKFIPKEDGRIPSQMFGIECEPGWFSLLDDLLDAIHNHIKNYDRNHQNIIRSRIIRNFIGFYNSRSQKVRKFLKPIKNFLEKYAKRHSPKMEFYITQIKEKFGGLRFYYMGGDDYIDGAIALAEMLSYNICETCGTNKEVGRTRSGWIHTICKPCLLSNERLKNSEWSENKIREIYHEDN